MTYATTFSGIGGWEIGLNACGWELKWQCECDPFCRTLLNERFGVPIYDDIRTVCGQNPPPVDALIGSPPCQPFSVAGKKRGASDERHLYPAFLGLVRHIKPRWVLMEQVPAILTIDRGRVFGSYLAGLAALGFDIVWHCIPACAVGAPHRRDRVWIMAHAQRAWGREQLRTNAEREPLSKAERKEGAFGIRSSSENVADCERNGLEVVPCQQRDNDAKFSPTQRSDLWRDWWETEPNIRRVANGIPFRVDRLKGLGNAVVPQIPFLIGQSINAIENS